MVSLLPEGTIDLHEGDDDLDVCARISSPPDGLRETVIVQLSINGEQTGIHCNNINKQEHCNPLLKFRQRMVDIFLKQISTCTQNFKSSWVERIKYQESI